ncbi:MAG: hypothetical protein RJB38_1257 [Pseudomonadota bacterium]|jgi:hypothetical protein
MNSSAAFMNPFRRNQTIRSLCSLLLGSFCLALTAGCAKDRDYWDWRRDRLNEGLTSLQSVAGAYRGTLTSEKTGEALGALEVALSPQIKVVPGLNGERSDGQPVLAARMTFEDAGTRFAVTALDSYFDEKTGKIQVTLMLSRNGGRSEQVVLSGSISSEAMGGHLEITGAPELAAAFTLKKNSKDSLSEIVQKLKSGANLAGGSGSLNLWKGKTRFSDDGEERLSSLVFIEPNSSPEELFLNRFAPVREVQFTVNFGNSVKLIHDGALWDQRTGKLTGRARITQGAQSSEILSECQLEPLETGAHGRWVCSHQAQGLGEVARTEAQWTQDSQPADSTDPSSDRRAVIVTERMGHAELESGKALVWLKASLPARTLEQELWALFMRSPDRTLTLTLAFQVPNQKDQDRVVILFDQALLDLRTRVLDARALIRQLQEPIEVQLRCENFRLPGTSSASSARKMIEADPELSCRYWSSHRQKPLVLHFDARS